MSDSESEEAIFSSLNIVLVGWLLLLVLPRWNYTSTLVLNICVAYSILYTILLSSRMYDDAIGTNPLPEGGGFDSLNGVYALFRDRQVVLAGWTHYIAFDLFVGRYIVMDSQVHGIPHLYICPLIPVTLNAGPIGLVGYTALKQLWSKTNFMNFDQRLLRLRLRRIILPGLYIAVSLLCIQMVLWVFVFPSTIFSGYKWHDEMIRRGNAGGAVPLNTNLKYAGHAAVKLTHILPSTIWSASIPFQLHPKVRRTYKALHRLTGYAFFCTSFLLIIGIVLIDRRKLYWHLADYPPIPNYEHISKFQFIQQSAQYIPEYTIYAVTAWFTFTAIAALAFVRKKNFAQHQNYVIRHVASGIWVAVQRVLLVIFTPTLKSQIDAKEAFFDCLLYGCLICFSCAELAIWALGTDHQARRSKQD